MNSLANSAVLGLVPVPPTAAYERARRREEVLQRKRQRHCFVEGAMIAPSTNDEVLLKEEQP